MLFAIFLHIATLWNNGIWRRADVGDDSNAQTGGSSGKHSEGKTASDHSPSPEPAKFVDSDDAGDTSDAGILPTSRSGTSSVRSQRRRDPCSCCEAWWVGGWTCAYLLKEGAWVNLDEHTWHTT